MRTCACDAAVECVAANVAARRVTRRSCAHPALIHGPLLNLTNPAGP